MRLKKEEVEQEDSDDGYVAEVVSQGGDGTDGFFIPRHWHRVRHFSLLHHQASHQDQS
jgi:hypothetical protein